MSISHETTVEKHLITQHNNLVQGRLKAFTYCGWVYVDERMEGAYAYGGWWKNPDLTSYVCEGCLHVVDCEHADPGKCGTCKKIDTEPAHPLKR